MIEQLITIIGIVVFIDLLFGKWEIWNKLYEWSTKSKSKFIYKLFKCRFCLMFHLSFITTLIYASVFGFSHEQIFIPLISTSLIIKLL